MKAKPPGRVNKFPGGYRREANYFYLPLAVERIPYATSGWKLGWIAEFDYFLRGRQVSHLSDTDPGYNDTVNKQDRGFGLKGSLKFYRKGERQDVVIEPFVRYWRIAKSDTDVITYNGIPVAVGWEPANNSTEYGLRISLWF